MPKLVEYGGSDMNTMDQLWIRKLEGGRNTYKSMQFFRPVPMCSV